ncbi:hypothetical protein AAG906_004110 [Vitis piasezkii]
MKVFSICHVSIVMLSIIIISTNLMIPFYTVVAAETNCSNGDIVIAQSSAGTLPSGIPSFSVEITNACAGGCSISNLHLKCGMFASAVLVNPKIFRRLDPRVLPSPSSMPTVFNSLFHLLLLHAASS